MAVENILMFMINLQESMGLDWDQTHDHWVSNQTRYNCATGRGGGRKIKSKPQNTHSI